MVEKLKTALSVLFLVALTSCFEMSGTTATETTGAGVTEVSSGLTSAATDATPEAGETELNDSSGVGTVVYLPSKPKELNTMTLMLGAVDDAVREEVEAEEVEEETGEAEEIAEDDEGDGIDASSAVYPGGGFDSTGGNIDPLKSSMSLKSFRDG